jgi:GTP-binding protein HflX
VDEDALFRDFGADASVKISAKTGAGLDEFYSGLARMLRDSRVYIDTVIPYRNTAVVAEIRKAGQLLSEDYEEEGVHITAYVPRALAAKRELE